MSALDRLAERMFGRQRLETTAAMASVDTQTYIGIATSDSADGSVSVVLSDDVTQPDNGIWDGDTFLASDELGTSVELPTTTAVKKGDRVLVTASGANVMTSPVVTGVVGRGDEQQAQIDAAAEAAASVEGIAQEAKAEVEQVRQDVADFRDDVATTYATKVEREDGDDAVKTWVTTNYTNNNDLATTYATKTLVSQTKDAIELAASQTYETQSDAAATYATQSALTVGLDGIRSEVAEDYQPKGDYATTASMNSAIQQSASSIESSVAATYETKSDAAATYATKTEVQQTASGLDTRITTAQSTADGAYLERTATGTTVDTTGAATIRSLVVEGQSVQDGTPTPDAPVPIVSVEGRNLFEPLFTAETTIHGITYIPNADGTFTTSGTASANSQRLTPRKWLPAGTYRLSGCPVGGSGTTYFLRALVYSQENGGSIIANQTDIGSGSTLTIPSGGGWTLLFSSINANVLAPSDTWMPMLEYGTTAHPYQPYGCVTLVAGDSRTDIDLQGHALRSLPDGTHDEMHVDSLGRVTMTQRVGVTTTATTDGISATVGTDAMSTTGDLSDGATVIYQLATPQTISLGTIDLPTPADTLWLDAAIVPTMGATWWTVDGIAGQQALEAEVTERQTLIRQFSGGVLAGYVGNAIAALVNAAGSFDVVRTAWSGGVPSILGTLARYAASGISLFDAAGNTLAEFASDHVRIGGDVPIGDATTGGEASVQLFDQTSTHTSHMDASTYIDEQAAGGDYGAYYDMRNEVGITTSLDDDGRVVDTNSSGTASMQLTQELSYGITATDEQHNEVIAALVADASYSNGTAASHAAIRATASTTGSNDLSHAELIGDSIGIGTDEDSITYFGISSVISALRKASSLMPSTFALWAGTKVMNVGTNVSTFTLFTKAELQAIVGTSWTPTGSNCGVFVMNGDYGVTDAMMSASIDGSSIVRVHMNKTKTGNTRINYLIIRFA